MSLNLLSERENLVATKNLKKVIRKVYLNAKEKDPSKRTFHPLDYPTNWNNVIKYMEAKDKRMQFNALFRSLFKPIYIEDLKVYTDAGHKLSPALKKEMKQYAKEKAKKIVKTQLAAKAPVQQGEQGQV